MKFIFVIAVCLIGASHQFILGGWESVDANNETIKDLAQFATEHRNSQTNSIYYRTLVEIKSAKQQVVNGMKYELTLVFADTNCTKQDASAKLYPVARGAVKEECVYNIWIEASKDHPEITSCSCTDQFILGGWESVDANSETVKDLAQFATEHRNSQINSLHNRTLVEIKSAKQQIVAGMNYELNLLFAYTNCDVKLCPGTAKEECVYTIWTGFKNENPEITSSSCTEL